MSRCSLGSDIPCARTGRPAAGPPRGAAAEPAVPGPGGCWRQPTHPASLLRAPRHPKATAHSSPAQSGLLLRSSLPNATTESPSGFISARKHQFETQCEYRRLNKPQPGSALPAAERIPTARSAPLPTPALPLPTRWVAWHGVAWHGMTWCGVAWYEMVWHGVVWHGVVWRGVAWRGMAWHPAGCPYGTTALRGSPSPALRLPCIPPGWATSPGGTARRAQK